MTDPTLDNAGKLYHHGYGTFSRKLSTPALHANDLKNIDLVLLSHHQHKDNFDNKGQAFASTIYMLVRFSSGISLVLVIIPWMETIW